MVFEASKTGFAENKGQSGPSSIVSKTLKANVGCQLNFRSICQLSVKILVICQLSVNPIHTLLYGKRKSKPRAKSELRKQQYTQ